MIANSEIRVQLLLTSVKQYELAEKLGLSEPGLSTKLRKPLPDDEKQKLLALIAEIEANHFRVASHNFDSTAKNSVAEGQ